MTNKQQIEIQKEKIELAKKRLIRDKNKLQEEQKRKTDGDGNHDYWNAKYYARESEKYLNSEYTQLLRLEIHFDDLSHYNESTGYLYRLILDLREALEKEKEDDI